MLLYNVNKLKSASRVYIEGGNAKESASPCPIEYCPCQSTTAQRRRRTTTKGNIMMSSQSTSRSSGALLATSLLLVVLLCLTLLCQPSAGFTTISQPLPQRSYYYQDNKAQQQQQQQWQWQWQADDDTFTWRLSTSSTDTEDETETSILDLEEPAGIVGAKFFGGNKEKEEYFDPVAEAEAGGEIELADTEYQRFQDIAAFDTPMVAQVARGLQSKLNSILYGGATAKAKAKDDEQKVNDIQYDAGTVAWESCFDTKTGKNPLAGLEEALPFYKSVDLAIVSGTQLGDNRVQLQWQISVVWPIFWEPRVLLAGFSELTLNGDGTSITKQVDRLDSSSDLVSTIGSQLQPRFWDTYHIGMTPSAEIMPRIMRKQGFLPKPYNLFEIPARLVSSPTQLDSAEGRIDGNAQIVPNHAFSCVIKTMGPQKQEFVPVSPLQVQIMPSGKGEGSPPRLKWSVPMSAAFQTKGALPLPGEDPEARPNSEPTCEYEFQPRRLVATLPYGGDPQDVEISDMRKKLYEAIVKDGLKPKLDENGRPQFFFLQNNVKACSTDEGLGMCVYEWRPESSEPNDVGIELEL